MIELPKIINKSELSRTMGIYPQTLNSKLLGKNRHIFTEEDKNKVLDALEKAIEEVKAIKT